jgi:hypothetical protein
MHYQRLSRQFQKTLDHLREIQSERAERRDLKDAAAIFELHKHKGVPWEPATSNTCSSTSHLPPTTNNQ